MIDVNLQAKYTETSIAIEKVRRFSSLNKMSMSAAIATGFEAKVERDMMAMDIPGCIILTCLQVFEICYASRLAPSNPIQVSLNVLRPAYLRILNYFDGRHYGFLPLLPSTV